jgi:hypothetical protein
MLFAVLVVSGVALVLSACGGGGGSAQQEVNARRQSLSGKLLTVYRTLFTEVPGRCVLERWASGRAIGSVGMLTFLSAAIVAVFLSGAERE